MKHAPIFDVIEKWSERKVNGEKFNDVFQMDGIPVWYFLEPLIKLACLPRPFESLAGIEKGARKGRTHTRLGELKLKLTHFGLRKGLWLNEKIKWSISSSKRRKAGERDVLFLGYTNQTVRGKRGELKPIGFSDVVKNLKKKGMKPLVLFCDPISENSFRGLLKFPDLLYSYVDSKILKESKKLSRELNQEWKKISEGKKAKLFTFNGKSYWRFLKDEMNFLFSSEMLATLTTYYLTFKKVIEDHRIKVVYLTALGGFYEALLMGVVYKLDKKIVYSPHGYGDRYLVVRDEFIENVSFAALGSEESQRLLKLGIKNENIFTTGPPFFDEIVKYRKREMKKIKKTVALMTQPLVEEQHMGEKEYFNCIRRFLIQINKAKNVAKIVVKLHPRERYKSRYESIVKSLGLRNVRVIQELGKDALYSILSDSDLLVSYGSTTDIEGLMLGKNVVNIDGLKKGPAAEAAKRDKYRDAIVTIDKNGDLTGTITKILTNKDFQWKLKQKRQRYIANSFYKIDGKAYERVAGLITKVSQI